jgi:subtilase family serine protease
MKRVKKSLTKENERKLLPIAVTTLFVMVNASLHAQDGNAGIDEATTMVTSYFDSGANLMYAVGALLGLIGGVKVYQKWNHGDHDTGKVAAAWFGSCVFLVVVATVIKSFFGL